MPQRVREELSLGNLKTNRAKPKDFATSKIGSKYLYPIWSTTWSIFHFTNLILMPYYRIIQAPYPEPWPLNLSNWTYLALVSASLIDCLTSNFVFIKRKNLLEVVADTDPNIPWFQQVVWVLYNIASASILTSTLLLQSLIPFRTDPNSIIVQIVSPIHVILNIFISAKETRILHFYQPVLFMFLYILVNMGYSLIAGKRVYPLLNWNESPLISVAISMGILLIFVPLFHLFVYGIFRLRTYAIDKFNKRNEEDVPIFQ